MTYQEIIQTVALRNKLSELFVDNVWKAYWKLIKINLQTNKFKDDISKEEFDKLGTSINIPSLGKIYCTYDKYNRKRNKYKIKKEALNASN